MKKGIPEEVSEWYKKMAKKSVKSRFKGKSKKQRSEIMKELSLKRFKKVVDKMEK